MEIDEALKQIALLSSSNDASHQETARKIVGEYRLLAALKHGARYAEAKNVARILVRNLASVPNEKPFIEAVKRLKAFVNDIMSLPDLDAATTEQRVEEPPRVRFPVGTRVQIVSKPLLKKYLRPQWTLHHPLDPEFLRFAGSCTTVCDVSFYHGGDVLYQLADTGEQYWHEEALQQAR